MKNFKPTKCALQAMIALLPFAASAQPGHHRPLNIEEFRPYNATTPHHLGEAKTTTDNACRLIAMTDLHYNGSTFVNMDSGSYVYPSGRGSTVTSTQFWSGADSSFVYDYYSSTGTYAKAYKTIQVFDTHNNITASTIQRWIPYLSAWRNYLLFSETYDVSNHILTYTQQSWDTVAGAWTNAWTHAYSYNTSGQLETNTQQKWNVPMSAWRNYTKDTYTYDGAGNNTMKVEETWDSTAANWVNAYRYTSTFDASNDMTTQLREFWNTATSAWQNQYFSTYSSYVVHQPQTIEWKYWNNLTSAFQFSDKEIYTYNSFGQTTYWEDRAWSPASNNWILTTQSFAKRYYYQTYETSVNSISASPGKTDIFPVPAKNEIHINATWNEDQDFSVSITDMAGRTLKTWNVPSCREYNAVIPVSTLPSGHYIVNLSGRKGALTKQITIVK